jgi:TRAP-type C4-dicarboxylate transport system permease small subunit
MHPFVGVMDRISRAFAVVAAVLLAAATAVICWMVIYRALGNSTYWEIEFAVFLMVAGLFFGSPYCLMTGGHIGVDLLAHYLSSRSRTGLFTVVAVIGLLMCLYLTVVGAELAFESFVKGERTESTWRPYKWPVYATMPIGLGLTALQYVAELLRTRAPRGRPL